MHRSIFHKLVISPHAFLTQLQFVQRNTFFTIIRQFSSSSSLDPTVSNKQQEGQQQSFVVSYLINLVGLSPARAKLLSCIYKFDNLEKSDSVLAFFKEHGFESSHIARVVSWDPRCLNCKSPEKILLPKFEFLYSIGVSKDCLPDIICGCPSILTRSLENGVIQVYNILRKVVSSDKQVVTLLKRRPWHFLTKDTNNLTLNASFLKGIGVPQSKLLYLMGFWSDAVFLDHDKFCKCVNGVLDMGFDVSKAAFVWALRANFSQRNKEKLERSFKAYEKWGWSGDDILSAYRKYPQCMFLSEEHIMKKMDFLVNKIGIEPREVAKCSLNLCYSFEKRIFPRFSVVWFLEKKGLLQKNLSLCHILGPPDKKFIQNFITKYIEDAPEVSSVYQGKVDPFRA